MSDGKDPVSTNLKRGVHSGCALQEIATLISDCLAFEPDRRPRAREVVQRILQAPTSAPPGRQPSRPSSDFA